MEGMTMSTLAMHRRSNWNRIEINTCFAIHAMARKRGPAFNNDAMCLAVHALQLRHSLANFKNRNEFDAVVAALAPQPQNKDD